MTNGPPTFAELQDWIEKHHRDERCHECGDSTGHAPDCTVPHLLDRNIYKIKYVSRLPWIAAR